MFIYDHPILGKWVCGKNFSLSEDLTLLFYHCDTVLILHCFVLVVGGDDNRNKQTGKRGHVTKKVRIKFNNFAFRLPR